MVTPFLRLKLVLLFALFSATPALACNWPVVNNWAQFAAACRACGGEPRFGAGCHYKNGGGGGGGYIPPAPDPSVLALQRANSRFAQLLQNLPDGLLDRDSWMTTNRGTSDDFAATANELFSQLNQKNISYQNSTRQWQNIKRYFDSIDANYPRRSGTLRNQITEYSRAEARDEKASKIWDASNYLVERTTDELTNRTTALRLAMESDRQVVSQIFSVMLPPSMVTINADIAANLERYWPTYLSFPSNPLLLPALPTAEIPAFPASEVPPLETAVPLSLRQSAPLSGAPEEIVGTLENAAQRLTAVYGTWSGISSQETGRKAGIAQKVGQLQALSKKAQQLSGMAVVMNANIHGLLQKAESLDTEYQAARNSFAMQTVESTIWRQGKRIVMDTIRDEYKAFLTNTLELTDQQTFDHYAKGEGNIFSLPDTFNHAAKLKAVQDNILTLLQHGNDYALTAAQMLAQASPSEIQEFAGHLYQGMSDDSEVLVKSSLGATNLPPEFRSILTKYIINTANKPSP